MFLYFSEGKAVSEYILRGQPTSLPLMSVHANTPHEWTSTEDCNISPRILGKCTCSSNCFLNFKLEKLLFVLVSSHAGTGTWSVMLYIVVQLLPPCFPIPAISVASEKYLVSTEIAIHIPSSMGHLGSIRNVVWRHNKCKFPRIEMRKTYYTNVVGITVLA